MDTSEVAIVVPSCDNFSDVWAPFYAFFFKYWRDCPYAIYHGSNYLKYEHPKVTSIPSNQDTDWSTRLKYLLKKIQQKYVILILEDYFIYEPVDQKTIFSAIDVMNRQNALFFKLFCWPAKFNALWQYKKLENASAIGVIEQNAPYKMCTQIGVWNRNLLIDLLKEGESIWQFETNGNKRAQLVPNPCLCIIEDAQKNYTHGPITYLCTAISKGVWMRDAIELCKKESIALEIKNRKIETKFEYLFRRIYAQTPLSKRKYLDFIKSKFFKFQY